MEIVLVLLVVAVAAWWWISRDKPSKGEMETLVAPYKVDTPVEEQKPETVIVVPDAVVPAAILEQAPTKPARKPAAPKKTATAPAKKAAPAKKPVAAKKAKAAPSLKKV